MRLLVVVNKALPDNDYRRAFPALSRAAAEVVFGLPERPPTLEPDRFVCLGFGEGVSRADILDFLDLYRLLRRERGNLDVVHFYSTKLVLLGPLIASMARVPSIVTINGFGRVWNSDAAHHRAMRPLYLMLTRLSARLSRAVLFQNHGDQQFLAAKLPQHAGAFRYVGSGIAGAPFTGKDFDAPRLVVTHVARLLPSKGIEDYLEIAAALAGGPFDFRLIGPPSRGQAGTLRAVRAADARGVVRYLGELSPGDTERELRDAHILLFTSHGEGMSRVMLEAGFAGACPVAFDIAANRDLVAADRGFLVRRGDMESAADILRRLAADRALLKQNAAAYQRHVVAEFSAESFSARLDDVLSEVRAAKAAEVRGAS